MLLPSTSKILVGILLFLCFCTVFSLANDEVSKSRPKRYLALWCMNFPDCCDFRGKDVCGFACPKCPIKLDKYGRRKKPKTTPKPSLRNQLQSKEPFSRFFFPFLKNLFICAQKDPQEILHRIQHAAKMIWILMRFCLTQLLEVKSLPS